MSSREEIVDDSGARGCYAVPTGSGVPREGLGVQTPPPSLPRNSEVLTKLTRISCSVENNPYQPNKNTGFTHLQIGRNPWLGGYRPQIPILSALCPQLNLLNTPAEKKFLGTPLPTGKLLPMLRGISFFWHVMQRQWMFGFRRFEAA
jgi:hypothetical protein